MRWIVLTLQEGAGQGSGRLPENWGYPKELIDKITAICAIDNTQKSIRFFPQFGLVVILAPDNLDHRLLDLPGVAYVLIPQPIGGSSTGIWYVNLLSAWDYVIARSADFEGVAVNLSLGPPPSTFDPNEPMNRATRVAHERGIIVIAAAGNRGEEGNNTMTPWAAADWVISVGATDINGRRVESYSSRGVPGHPTMHPTVVAAGMQEPPSEAVGTSFAAPQVTDIVMFLAAFLLALWKGAGQPVAELKKIISNVIGSCLLHMARPVRDERHVCGAGFVSLNIALEFLRNLDVSQLSVMLPQPEWLSERFLKSAQEGLTLAPLDFLAKNRLARISVDTTYEWSRACFVPGLLRMQNYFLLREGDRFDPGEYFDVASREVGEAEFIEISILPHGQRARHLLVSREKTGAFRTITEAIASAGEWDIIHVEPGLYVESLQLKSGITLHGQKGVVIHNPYPVTLDKVKDVALVNLEILAEGPRCSAVTISSTRNVTLINCKLVSKGGNALNVYCSARCLLDRCAMFGEINAAYFAFGSEFSIQNCEIEGRKEGLLLYATSATVSRCQISGQNGHAIFFIQPGPRWHNPDEKLLVYVHPMGSSLLTAVDVSPQTVKRNDLVGRLARIFYALEVNDSTLQGSRASIAANGFNQVFLNSCRAAQGMFEFAVIHSPKLLPVGISGVTSLKKILQLVQESLSKVEIEYLPKK